MIQSRSVWAVVACCLFAGRLAAQTPEPDTRAAQIEKQRNATQQATQKSDTDALERTLAWIKKHKLVEVFTKGWNGFTPTLGGMVTGSGFGGGVQWLRPNLLGGELSLRSSARLSTSLYQLYDGEIGLPRLADNHAFLDLYVRHRDYPQLTYYGPGPDSRRSGHTDYRLEDTSYDVSAGVRPISWLMLGGTAGYLQTNLGRGTDDHYASTEQVYTATQAAAINRQPDFIRAGGMAVIDWRDNPSGPKSGGQYYARFDAYNAQGSDEFSFRRLTAEVQQYVPLFHKKRGFALRAQTILSFPDRNQRVPFYLQPSVGGPDDLRGFRPFRFYDNNSFITNSEWRWEILSSVEGAVFADAGEVFPHPGAFDLSRLRTSYGAGLRFRSPSNEAIVMRLDAAGSSEGFHVWLTFHDLFATPRVRTGQQLSPPSGRLP